jgi:hypothetical protein
MGEDAPQSDERWEREFALKEAEFRLRKKQAGFFHNYQLLIGLIAAALALCGNLIATSRQAQSAEHQAASQAQTAERQAHVKAQSDLVIEAIKTGDPKRAARNLQFLITLGLLDDPGGKMQAVLSQHPDQAPVLPARGYGDGGYGNRPYGDPSDRPPKK